MERFFRSKTVAMLAIVGLNAWVTINGSPEIPTPMLLVSLTAWFLITLVASTIITKKILPNGHSLRAFGIYGVSLFAGAMVAIASPDVARFSNDVIKINTSFVAVSESNPDHDLIERNTDLYTELGILPAYAKAQAETNLEVGGAIEAGGTPPAYVENWTEGSGKHAFEAFLFYVSMEFASIMTALLLVFMGYISRKVAKA